MSDTNGVIKQEATNNAYSDSLPDLEYVPDNTPASTTNAVNHSATINGINGTTNAHIGNGEVAQKPSQQPKAKPPASTVVNGVASTTVDTPVTDYGNQANTVVNSIATTSIAKGGVFEPMTLFLQYKGQTKKYNATQPVTSYNHLYQICSKKYTELSDIKYCNSDIVQYYVKDKQFDIFTVIEDYSTELYNGRIIDARINNNIDINSIEAGEIVTDVQYIIDRVGETAKMDSKEGLSNSIEPVRRSRSKRSRSPYKHRSRSRSPRDRRRRSNSYEKHDSDRHVLKLGRTDSYNKNVRDGRSREPKIVDVRDARDRHDSRRHDDTKRDDSKSKSKDEFVIRLSGLPYSVTNKELCTFLYSIRIANHGSDIHREYDTKDRFTGIAFVTVQSQYDLEKALKLNNTHLGKQYIKVTQSSADIRDRTIVNENARIRVIHSATTQYIKCSGLPYTVTEHAIKQFFSDVKLNNVYLCSKYGKNTGVAYIECSDIYNANQALKYDHKKLDWRYVELVCVSRSEIDDAIKSGLIQHNTSTQQHTSTNYISNNSVTHSTQQLCIRMYGLLPDHDQNHIKSFFAPQNIVPTRIHRKPRGDTAYIEFNTNTDAQTAMKLHKQYIGNRYMELRIVPYNEVAEIVGLPLKHDTPVVQPIQQQSTPSIPYQQPYVPTHVPVTQPPVPQPHQMPPSHQPQYISNPYIQAPTPKMQYQQPNPPNMQYQPSVTSQQSTPQFDPVMYQQYLQYQQQQQQQQSNNPYTSIHNGANTGVPMYQAR